MTIDERLDKLTERHEALTLSLELLEHKVQSIGDSLDRLIALATPIVKLVADHEARIARLEGGSAAQT
jgi:hypothetical protein